MKYDCCLKASHHLMGISQGKSVLYQVLYGEALLGGPAPHRFRILIILHMKKVPLTHTFITCLMNKSSKKKSSCVFHVVPINGFKRVHGFSNK